MSLAGFHIDRSKHSRLRNLSWVLAIMEDDWYVKRVKNNLLVQKWLVRYVSQVLHVEVSLHIANPYEIQNYSPHEATFRYAKIAIAVTVPIFLFLRWERGTETMCRRQAKWLMIDDWGLMMRPSIRSQQKGMINISLGFIRNFVLGMEDLR